MSNPALASVLSPVRSTVTKPPLPLPPAPPPPAAGAPPAAVASKFNVGSCPSRIAACKAAISLVACSPNGEIPGVAPPCCATSCILGTASAPPAGMGCSFPVSGSSCNLATESSTSMLPAGMRSPSCTGRTTPS